MLVRKKIILIFYLVLFLVGNKFDLYKLVPEEEAKSLAKELNATYLHVSAADGTGINELFYYIGKKYLNPNWSQEDEKGEEKEEEKKEEKNKIRRGHKIDNKQCILL